MDVASFSFASLRPDPAQQSGQHDLDQNPFLDSYLVRAVQFLAAPPYNQDGLTIHYVRSQGFVPDYLNDEYHWQPSPEYPVLKLDGRPWMSLSAMELQSHYLPLVRAQGRVATAGLGLGWFALRAAAKPDVLSVDVYELDQRVLTYFRQAYRDRPELAKIKLIEGDARANLIGRRYDYVYLDLYPVRNDDQAPVDLAWVQRNNLIGSHGVDAWTFERQLADAYLAWGLAPTLRTDEIKFFMYWGSTPLKKCSWLAKSKAWSVETDPSQCLRWLLAMGRVSDATTETPVMAAMRRELEACAS